MLVRLKPYNPRIGHVLRRFVSLPHKLRIRGDRGWYDIQTVSKLEYLKTVCQNSLTIEENDALGNEIRLAFDIADDKDHALKIVESYRAREGRDSKGDFGTIESPIPSSRRPGRKTAPSSESSEAPKRKTRKRKSAADKARGNPSADADDSDE